MNLVVYCQGCGMPNHHDADTCGRCDADLDADSEEDDEFENWLLGMRYLIASDPILWRYADREVLP